MSAEAAQEVETMRKHVKLGLLGLVMLAVMASACAPQPVLVRQEIVGGKSIKHILLLTNSDGDGNLYDYIMRVCNYDEQGREINCKDSTILRDVKAQSVY
jgi:hypothetical protein